MKIPTTDPTRYEIIMLDLATGEKILVAYTPRKSRDGLIAAMRDRRGAINAFTGPLDWWKADQAKAGVLIGDYKTKKIRWNVKFSGRTQREAVDSCTNLPSIITLAQKITTG